MKDILEKILIENNVAKAFGDADISRLAQKLADAKGQGWSNKKPDKAGTWLRSNPALQKDITRQTVVLVNGVLKTNHPQNEGSQEIPVKDMPDRFLWFYVPPTLPSKEV